MVLNQHQQIILPVGVVAFILGTIFVAFYTCSCLLVVKKLRFADYLMLLAWLFDVALAVCLFVALGKGLGIHVKDVEPQNEVALNKATYVFVIFYDLASMAAKASILIFFLSLTHGRKAFHVVNYAAIVAVLVVGTALVIKQIFHCSPVSAGFRFHSQRDHCEGIFSSFLVTSPYNLITDLAILLLPIPLLTRMTLPFRQKVIIVMTFGLGILVILIDLTRIAFLEHNVLVQLRLIHKAEIGAVDDSDYTWRYPFSFMWSTLEVNMILICACVPTLRPLAARFSPSLIRNKSERSHSANETFDENQKAPDRHAAFRGELMDLITSRLEAEADLRNASTRGGSVSFEEVENDEPPIINVLNRKPPSIPRLNLKKSLPPIALITILFFFWGFSYGLITFLGFQFRHVIEASPIQERGIHGAYFGGYLIGGLALARAFLKKTGFAGSFIAGLYIYACGAFVFWPSATLLSLPTFVVSNFIAGTGIGVLQAAAALYVSICGPLEYSEIRLCIAEFFQGVGEVAAAELTKKIVFKDDNHPTGLAKAQWTYVAIAFVAVLLSIIFYYLPLPEASNDELRLLAAQRPENRAKVWGFRTCNVTFVLGACSMFFYIGGHEAHSTQFRRYVSHSNPGSKLGPNTMLVIGFTAWSIGRLSSAFIMWRLLKPRRLLLILHIGLIVLAAICMHATGVGAVVASTLIYLFSGGVLPITFAISVRGTAQHAKTAASLLVAAIGGASWPPFAQRHAEETYGLPFSYFVSATLFSVAALFAVYLNCVPQAKRQVDPVKDDYLKEE